MESSFGLGSIVVVANKDKSYIHYSGKDDFVTVFYSVSGES